jgi:AraC-like DNA-binding protein
MWIHRVPGPALRPWIKALWACQETSRRAAGVTRERVLPTGATYVVFRLDHPLRLFNGIADPAGRLVAHAVVGGARSAFCVKDISQPLRSVGAELLPGAAESLLGTPADELAGRHTPVFDLWGREASIIRERLLDAGNLNQSHFNREFREFAGISPGQYRKAATLLPSHVPIRPA